MAFRGLSGSFNNDSERFFSFTTEQFLREFKVYLRMINSMVLLDVFSDVPKNGS